MMLLILMACKVNEMKWNENEIRNRIIRQALDQSHWQDTTTKNQEITCNNVNNIMRSIQLLHQYSINDIDNDVSERPPYTLFVKPHAEGSPCIYKYLCTQWCYTYVNSICLCNTCIIIADVPKFFLMGIHMKPSNAVKEID